MKQNKILILVVIMTMLFSNTVVFAEGSLPFEISEMKVGLVIDGKITTWDEAEYGTLFTTSKGRSMMPARIIAELLGFTVGWENETQTVSISKDDQEIKFPLGATEISTPNGVLIMEVPALTIKDRTHVPVRFAAEALGVEVDWKSHKNVEGSNAYPYDFYVVLSTEEESNKVAETVLSDFDFSTNDEIQAIIDNIDPTMERYVNANTILVGESAFINAKQAHLNIYNRGDITRFTVNNYDISKDVLSNVMTVMYGSDSGEIINTLENSSYDIAGKWLKASKGTEYMIDHGIVGGVDITVKND